VQVPLYVVDEMFVELFLCIDDFAVSQGSFFALVDESHVVFAIKETRNFTTCKKSIHSFEECGGEDIAFVKNEADLLLLASCSLHHTSQVFIEIKD